MLSLRTCSLSLSRVDGWRWIPLAVSFSSAEPWLCNVIALGRKIVRTVSRLWFSIGTNSSSRKKFGSSSLRKFVGGPYGQCQNFARGMLKALDLLSPRPYVSSPEMEISRIGESVWSTPYLGPAGNTIDGKEMENECWNPVDRYMQ